jgi:hypothetical protein
MTLTGSQQSLLDGTDEFADIHSEVVSETAPIIPNPFDVLFDPEQFASYFLYILDKQKRLRLLRYNPAQRDFMGSRSGRDLILKARQLGFSTAVQGEQFRRAVTSTVTAITMAHDDQTTQKLRRMQERFWTHCRINSVQPTRKYSNATLVSYPDFDSTITIATAGSKEAGRGDTYSDFHGSEVAFWSDAERIMAGAMQGGNPDIVLESTPNGSTGWFYERCMEALRGEGVWKLHFYPWWWEPEYRIALEAGEVLTYNDEEAYLSTKYGLAPEQIKWRRLKQKELKRKFIQEYPEDPESCFLGSGLSYFGNLASNFHAPLKVEPILKAVEADEANGVKALPAHKYSAGLDWGRENDFTDLVILDITTCQQVDLLHVNKMRWGDIRKRVAAMCHKWGIGTVVAEENSIGSVNIEELRKLDVKVHPFSTTNTSKSEIMSDLYDAFNEKNLQLQPYPEAQYQFTNFVSTQLNSGVWRIAAAGKGHDDIVIATALAWYARKYARVQVWL